ENAGSLGERAGSGHDRLPEVPRQHAAVIGTTALGTVAVGQAGMNAQCRVHGPDRHARLGRVDRQGGAFRNRLCGMLHQHGNLSSESSLKSIEIVRRQRRRKGERPPLTMRVYSSSSWREKCAGWCTPRTTRGGSGSPFFFSSQGGVIIFQIRVLTRRSISR